MKMEKLDYYTIGGYDFRSLENAKKLIPIFGDNIKGMFMKFFDGDNFREEDFYIENTCDVKIKISYIHSYNLESYNMSLYIDHRHWYSEIIHNTNRPLFKWDTRKVNVYDRSNKNIYEIELDRFNILLPYIYFDDREKMYRKIMKSLLNKYLISLPKFSKKTFTRTNTSYSDITTMEIKRLLSEFKDLKIEKKLKVVLIYNIITDNIVNSEKLLIPVITFQDGIVDILDKSPDIISINNNLLVFHKVIEPEDYDKFLINFNEKCQILRKNIFDKTNYNLEKLFQI